MALVYSRKDLYTIVHSSIIRHSQKVGTPKISTDWSVDKQNMVYPYNGMLFRNKMEWSADTWGNAMSLKNVMLSESQIQKTIYHVIPLIKNNQKRQSLGRMHVTTNGHQGSFGVDGSVLKIVLWSQLNNSINVLKHADCTLKQSWILWQILFLSKAVF